MKKLTLLFSSALLTLSLSGCFEPIHVKEITVTQVPANIHSVSQVEKAIKIAASGLNWRLEQRNGIMTAIKETSRNRIVVSIPYSKHGYKIHLKSAINMGYHPDKNTINAEYNTEVTNLSNAIDVNLYAR